MVIVANGSLIEHFFPDHSVSVSDKGAAVWIVYPSRPDLSAKVRAFVHFVKQRLSPAGHRLLQPRYPLA